MIYDTTFSWHKNLLFSWPPSCKYLSNRLNSKDRKHIVYNNVMDQKMNRLNMLASKKPKANLLKAPGDG